jgi:putative transposase
MPFVKVWVHLIWSTKHRVNSITSDLKYKLYDHIRENAIKKDIYLDYINGTEDHIHLLVSVKGEQSLSKITQLIKGESSFWINQNNMTEHKFEWQDEYIAVSVSESVIPNVRSYIKNQEEHHKKKSFNEEMESILESYSSKKISG